MWGAGGGTAPRLNVPQIRTAIMPKKNLADADNASITFRIGMSPVDIGKTSAFHATTPLEGLDSMSQPTNKMVLSFNAPVDARCTTPAPIVWEDAFKEPLDATVELAFSDPARGREPNTSIELVLSCCHKNKHDKSLAEDQHVLQKLATCSLPIQDIGKLCASNRHAAVFKTSMQTHLGVAASPWRAVLEHLASTPNISSMTTRPLPTACESHDTHDFVMVGPTTEHVLRHLQGPNRVMGQVYTYEWDAGKNTLAKALEAKTIELSRGVLADRMLLASFETGMSPEQFAATVDEMWANPQNITPATFNRVAAFVDKVLNANENAYYISDLAFVDITTTDDGPADIGTGSLFAIVPTEQQTSVFRNLGGDCEDEGQLAAAMKKAVCAMPKEALARVVGGAQLVKFVSLSTYTSINVAAKSGKQTDTAAGEARATDADDNRPVRITEKDFINGTAGGHSLGIVLLRGATTELSLSQDGVITRRQSRLAKLDPASEAVRQRLASLNPNEASAVFRLQEGTAICYSSPHNPNNPAAVASYAAFKLAAELGKRFDALKPSRSAPSFAGKVIANLRATHPASVSKNPLAAKASDFVVMMGPLIAPDQGPNCVAACVGTVNKKGDLASFVAGATPYQAAGMDKNRRFATAFIDIAGDDVRADVSEERVFRAETFRLEQTVREPPPVPSALVEFSERLRQQQASKVPSSTKGSLLRTTWYPRYGFFADPDNARDISSTLLLLEPFVVSASFQMHPMWNDNFVTLGVIEYLPTLPSLPAYPPPVAARPNAPNKKSTLEQTVRAQTQTRVDAAIDRVTRAVPRTAAVLKIATQTSSAARGRSAMDRIRACQEAAVLAEVELQHAIQSFTAHLTPLEIQVSEGADGPVARVTASVKTQAQAQSKAHASVVRATSLPLPAASSSSSFASSEAQKPLLGIGARLLAVQQKALLQQQARQETLLQKKRTQNKKPTTAPAMQTAQPIQSRCRCVHDDDNACSHARAQKPRLKNSQHHLPPQHQQLPSSVPLPTAAADAATDASDSTAVEHSLRALFAAWQLEY